MKKIILYQCEHCGFTTSQKIINCTSCGRPDNIDEYKRVYTTCCKHYENVI